MFLCRTSGASQVYRVSPAYYNVSLLHRNSFVESTPSATTSPMQLFRFLLPSLLTTTVMDNIDTPFTIEIGGKPIATISDSADTRTQAKAETGTDAAIFTLKDGRLGCGGWMLGRNITEDRSFLPKQVLWFKMAEEDKKTIQPVAAKKNGDSYVLTFGGMYRGSFRCVCCGFTDRSFRGAIDRGGRKRSGKHRGW